MKRLIAAMVGGGIAVFAGTSAIEDDTTRNGQGQVIEAGGVGVFAIQVGDCVQLPDEELVQSVEAVPCGEPHDAQVYAEVDLPDGRFPGPAAVEEQAFDACIERWGEAVGTDWEADRLHDITAFYPTASSWQLDDREVQCMVVRIDGRRLTADLLEREDRA